MIRNNLSILMSERGIKNSTLSMRTGISKNAISSISQNDIKMIQLETINKMCQVLEIDPGDFFSYLPYDFEFTFVYEKFTPKIRLSEFGEWLGLYFEKISFDLFVKVLKADKELDMFEFESESFNLGVNLLQGEKMEIGFSSSTDDAERFSAFFQKIPVTFKIDIQKKIEDEFYGDLTLAIEEQIASLEEKGFANFNQLEVQSVISNLRDLIIFKFLPFDFFLPF